MITIKFTGPCGSGKSLLMQFLKKALKEKGIEVLMSDNPGLGNPHEMITYLGNEQLKRIADDLRRGD